MFAIISFYQLNSWVPKSKYCKNKQRQMCSKGQSENVDRSSLMRLALWNMCIEHSKEHKEWMVFIKKIWTSTVQRTRMSSLMAGFRPRAVVCPCLFQIKIVTLQKRSCEPLHYHKWSTNRKKLKNSKLRTICSLTELTHFRPKLEKKLIFSRSGISVHPLIGFFGFGDNSICSERVCL